MLSPSTILSFCAVVAIVISRTFALEETCSDSRARYFLQGPKGTGPALTCKNVDSQCKPKDRSHCPNSCGVCDEYGCSDSLYAFKVGSKRTKCNKIAELSPQKIKKKCMRSLIYYTCRATCGLCDTDAPSSVPTTSAPTEDPTEAPTGAPTEAPTTAPMVCNEELTDKFYHKQNTKGGEITKSCDFLANTASNNQRKKLCRLTNSGPISNLPPAQIVCRVTCETCAA